MVSDGAILKGNEMIDLSGAGASSHKPRLSHVSPITPSQAELYLSTCRQITKGCKELVL